MRQIFFQANYCAHCGNELGRASAGVGGRAWWRPAYLCLPCSTVLRRGRAGRLVILAAAILLLGSIARRFAPPPRRVSRAASALDATPRRNAIDPPPAAAPGDLVGGSGGAEERVFCGALTRRGTPCRRLVRPGQRCRQHRQS